MTSSDLDQLRATYRHLTNEALADLYAQGPGSLRSAEAWQLLQDEYDRRGSALVDLQDAANTRHEDRRAKDAAEAELIQHYAPFYLRIVQGSIDLALAVGLAFAALLAIQALGTSRDFQDLLLLPVFFLVFLGSTAIVEWRTGSSPGMAILGLRVATPTGARPDLPRLILRAVLRPVGLAGAAFYAIAHTPWGHDVVSGTRVVRR